MTAQVALASNPGGTTAMWVRDRLDGLWSDEDFVGWYPRDGRPGLSPAQLPWPLNRHCRISEGRYLCGDHRATGSVQGAMDSGARAALDVLAALHATVG